MQLTRFEVLALLPDEPEVKGYQIVVSPSGRTTLEEWTQNYETVVDGLPENIHARLAWHKTRTELGILIFVKIGANPKTQVSFYLKPDPAKVRKRYRINPDQRPDQRPDQLPDQRPDQRPDRRPDRQPDRQPDRPKHSMPVKDARDSAAKS